MKREGEQRKRRERGTVRGGMETGGQKRKEGDQNLKPLGLGRKCDGKSGGIRKRETLAANTSSLPGLLGTHSDGSKKGKKERENRTEKMETVDVNEED